MFSQKRKLFDAVDGDADTPGSVATPGMTPGMTPGAMTPGGATPGGLTSSVMSPMTPSYSVIRENSGLLGVGSGAAATGGGGGENPDSTEAREQMEQTEEADGVGEELDAESEKELIKRIAMQNPFTPAGNADSKFTPWTDIATPAPILPGTPQTPAGIMTTLEKSLSGLTSDAIASMTTPQQKYGASKPVIHNVVATANLGVTLDLKKIAMTARNAEFNPRRFAAVIMRIREPKSTALVFKSGKLVVTGTKSEEEARHAARKFGRVIMKVGYESARFKDFRVENLVSTFNVPYPIQLENLYKKLPSDTHSQYEPEVFPGLICRAPGGTLLIFVSGKCVMIGMKTPNDIEKAYNFILPFLEQHRKK